MTRRTLVIGASSGIGRAVVVALADAGAAVAAAARRRVDDLPCTWVGGDVRREGECELMVNGAIGALGGLDAVVYAAGVAPLGPAATLDAATWGDLLATNVVGAALVTAAALPALQDANGRAVYLSSDSVPRPRPGLVPYVATKAALETLVKGWRCECAEVGFSVVRVGPTMTSFADGWDPRLLEDYMNRWQSEGHGVAGVCDPAAVAAQVVNVLTSGSSSRRSRSWRVHVREHMSLSTRP
jgi:NAD(P)-dependent dehydrogenase (short-subunit alcohol dehydrogenase family)